MYMHHTAQVVEACPVLLLCQVQAEAFGANRWDQAEFGNTEEKKRFLSLMVRGAASARAHGQVAVCVGGCCVC